MKGLGEKKSGTIRKGDVKHLKRSFQNGSDRTDVKHLKRSCRDGSPNSEGPNKAKKAVPVEKWGSFQKKKQDRHGSYLRPPKTELKLSTTLKETPQPLEKCRKSDKGFSAYSRRTMRKVFIEKCPKTVEEGMKEVTRRWSCLTSEERQSFIQQNKHKLYCICKKKYSESDGKMVACDLDCENWFHVKCIGNSDEYIDLVLFNFCVECILLNICRLHSFVIMSVAHY